MCHLTGSNSYFAISIKPYSRLKATTAILPLCLLDYAYDIWPSQFLQEEEGETINSGRN